MSTISLLSNTGYILANKNIAKRFGLDCAVLLGELASEYVYYKKEGKLIDGDWFFSTVENVKENTTLSEEKQRKAIKILESAGIIECKRKGLPAKRYIKINEEVLSGVLNTIEISSYQENSTSSSCKTRELDTAFCGINNNNNNNNNIINNIYSSSDDEQKKERVKNTDKEAEELFEALWKKYPVKRGKGSVKISTKRKLLSYGYEQMVRCIDRYVSEIKRLGKEDYYKDGSTFFNSGYIDFLDENYVERQKPKGGNGNGNTPNQKPEVASQYKWL